MQVPPSFAILSHAMFLFSDINKKKVPGKVEKQFTSTTRFCIPFSFSFFPFFFTFLNRVDKSENSRRSGRNAIFAELWSFPRKTFNRYFFKSIELQESTFRRTISIQPLKSALKDRESLTLLV